MGKILNTQALALHRLGRDREALRQLAAARKIHGKTASDYLVAALIYLQLGNNKRANESHRQGLELLQKLDAEERAGEQQDLQLIVDEIGNHISTK